VNEKKSALVLPQETPDINNIAGVPIVHTYKYLGTEVGNKRTLAAAMHISFLKYG